MFYDEEYFQISIRIIKETPQLVKKNLKKNPWIILKIYISLTATFYLDGEFQIGMYEASLMGIKFNT